MTRFWKALTIFTVCAVCTIQAHAVSINLGGSMLNGNDVLDFTGPNALDFDIDFTNNLPVWLQVDLGELDDAGVVTMKHAGLNFTQVPWTDYHVGVSGADMYTQGMGDGPTIQQVGAIFPHDGGRVTTNEMEHMTWIFFGTDQNVGVALGNDNDQWVIDLNGLQPGDSFMVHIEPSVGREIPEPVTACLGMLGIAALAYPRRRRRD